MNKIALIAASLSIATMAPLAAFAATQTNHPSAPLDQVLSSPQGQQDPLAAVAAAGYQPGSEEYWAVANTVAEKIPSSSPYFVQDVNNQLAVLSTSEEESQTE